MDDDVDYAIVVVVIVFGVLFRMFAYKNNLLITQKT